MNVRWGFIGAGYVASRAMAPAVHAAPGATLHAVASRDPKRSADLEPAVVHSSYDAIIHDPDVDAVYVSLTNVQHRQWVLAALNAGKHVLCEKPLAMNAAEVAEMITAAERNQRLLVEAVWTRWQPRMRRMADIVGRGDLGELVDITSAFTFQGDLTGNYRADPAFGGGALLDVGCYQAHLWLMLLAENVDFSIESVNRTNSSAGIDLTSEIHARLGTRITARALCSFDLPPQQSIAVTGTTSSMRTGDGEAFTMWKQQGSLSIGDTVEHFAPDDAFALMVHDVSAAIRGENAHLFPVQSSLRVAEILDAVREFGN